MRILIVSNACPPRFVGGAELVAYEQARALALLGHEVRFFAGDIGSPRPRHARTDDVTAGIRFYRIATVAEDYSAEYLNFLHPFVDDHFRDVLQEFQPDIVHCHNLMGLSVKLPIIARQSGARVVCTLHDFWGFCLRNTAIRADGRPCDNIAQCRACLPRLHDGRELHVPLRFRKDFIRLALDHVDRFVAPSRYMAGRYASSGFRQDRMAVIPNGIDIARFHPPAPPHPPSAGDIVITYVGYFGAHKGVTTLLEAAALLPDRGIAFRLVGEGPERNTYLALIEALGLGDRVRFLGKVSPFDMPAIYASSDIVVLPSIWDENQPVCLMEAMACGVPVVGSRKGGIPELIEHGGNGLMFAAGNVSDLAAQLLRMISDPVLRRDAGRTGRQCMERLSHARQARRLLDLYADVLRLPANAARPNLFGVTGSLHEPMTDEDAVLADREWPDRHFVPVEWIADTALPFDGALRAGRTWRVLRRLGIDAIFRFPRRFRRLGNALLSRIDQPVR